jgi:hypothetical protein
MYLIENLVVGFQAGLVAANPFFKEVTGLQARRSLNRRLFKVPVTTTT